MKLEDIKKNFRLSAENGIKRAIYDAYGCGFNAADIQSIVDDTINDVEGLQDLPD